MRPDGRRSNELRPVIITPNYSSYAEGSAMIDIGRTKVLCNVTVEEGVPRWMQHEAKPGGWVTGEYAMLPRSTTQRSPRETSGLGGRTQEIRRLIGRSLRLAVDLEKLGERTLIVDCDVLQADGGTRTASITGGYIALTLALRKLIQKGQIPPEALGGGVAAVSVGIVDGVPLLDLCYEEDSRAEVDANVVMNSEGNFIEIQTTAERIPFTRSMLDNLLNLAYRGIGQLLSLQKQTLEEIS